ncbi:MAG: superoxide dismutase [Parvibaculum sp.]|uniref:superoxide dismutase n=1 Tax=Parvibaculum sp. TaxID=2024848 RepID=UPI00284A2111|nr:superoxide dismutase [Parvibaculum sp.]MDR3499841.1 superoxide dismutase [Parvibaculum sp.]
MPFSLPDLPFSLDALQPYMSAKTLELHHGKHHRGYVTKLNELTRGTPFADMPLENVIRKTHDDPSSAAIFNNAAQHLNHSFFWTCMKPGGQAAPERLRKALARSFGDFDGFKRKFVAEGLGQFGSGWIWLVADKGALEIVKTSNAGTPVALDKQPLLVCDVWEHAYYVDYENRRADFLTAFVDHLADWEAVAGRLPAA